MIILTGQQQHEVPTSKINVIAPAADFHERIKYPGSIELLPEYTIYHASRCEQLHQNISRFWQHVFPQQEIPVTLAERKQLGSGMLHVIGLLDMTLKLSALHPCARIVWKYPESYLHPAAQLGLADALIDITKYFRSQREVVEEELRNITTRLTDATNPQDPA